MATWAHNLGANLFLVAGLAMAYSDGYWDGHHGLGETRRERMGRGFNYRRNQTNRARWEAGEFWWGRAVA